MAFVFFIVGFVGSLAYLIGWTIIAPSEFASKCRWYYSHTPKESYSWLKHFGAKFARFRIIYNGTNFETQVRLPFSYAWTEINTHRDEKNAQDELQKILDFWVDWLNKVKQKKVKRRVQKYRVGDKI